MGDKKPQENFDILKHLKVTESEQKQLTILKQVEEGVFVLILNKKANTFNKEFVREIHQQLDVVEKNNGPTVLLTVSSQGRIWSSGMDLNFVGSLSSHDRYAFVQEFIRLFGRMLSLSVPTVAAINGKIFPLQKIQKGYAIAGGCMFAFSHDYRVMREDIGYIQLNEVEINMHLPPGMCSTVQCKVSPQIYRDMALTAKKFDAKSAFQNGMIEKVCSSSQLYEEGLNLARQIKQHGQNKEIFKMLKEEAYAYAIDCCFNKGLPTKIAPRL